MKLSEFIIYSGIVAAGVVAVVISLVLSDSDQAYRQSVEKRREDILRFMVDSADSPIPLESRHGDAGLRYYDPDRRYVVEAVITPVGPSVAPMSLLTSADTEETYYPHSYADFRLEGSEYRLLLLQSREDQADNRLFLAFYDETNGSETYGGGRYMDVFPQEDGTAIIDFNRAYNPYCVYDVKYVCPVPPPENRLSIPIRAGESNYEPANP
jgi:uncharacterized protein (DUF1684 family)